MMRQHWAELAHNIKEHGVLQPVLLRPSPTGTPVAEERQAVFGLTGVICKHLTSVLMLLYL